jgi:hypothetical protein
MELEQLIPWVRRDYETATPHSQVDTVDHVDPAALAQDAQVMAIAAWGLLNGPRLPHQARISPVSRSR